MSDYRPTCEDGCGRQHDPAARVFVTTRRNWELLCDECAQARGVLIGRAS